MINKELSESRDEAQRSAAVSDNGRGAAAASAPATWTAPMVDRAEPPLVADERTSLEGWLDYYRQTLLVKCAGLTPEQLRIRSVPPSELSLLGLVRHLAEVERWWFRRCLAGEDLPNLYWSSDNPDADFTDVDTADAPTDFATYQAEVALAREIVKGRSLDEKFRHPRQGHQMDLRWLFLHMIEEYARHCGHADLIRERIDGVTGE